MASDSRGCETVLVVDDDATTVLIATASLEAAGLAVVTAEDGMQAIARFSEAHPDIVLLDVDMPGMNGFEVCAHIRRTDPGRHVPIIMATGMDDMESVTRAFESGATDFIAKPIHVPSLPQRVRYALRSAAALQELRVAEADMRAMLLAIPDAIFRIAPDGRVLAHHPGRSTVRLKRLDDCVGKFVRDVFPEDVATVVSAEVAACIETGAIRTGEIAVAISERTIHLEGRCVRAAGDDVLLFVRDITRRTEAAERIRCLAYQDSVTGMPNRQAFLETLERELALAPPSGRLAVIFLDLDGFKRINDTFGHSVGDLLLHGVATRLQHCTRSGDTLARPTNGTDVARLGGDEFTILVRDLEDPQDAIAVAQRVRDALARPFTIAKNEIVVTASLGIALYPDDAIDAAALLKFADTAMYHAKANGRNTFRLYNAALTASAMQRIELENGLRKALVRHEFALHYQPQVRPPGDRIFGMEALLRWNHPKRGLLLPGEFIGMAEETGLIVPIGEWVLRAACRQCLRWQQISDGPVRVAVNVSAIQFKADGFVAMVLSVLRETGLAPGLLDLEMTESTLMDSTETTAMRLNELKAVGINLSIDDFGAGYSSMSYLKRFPVDALKIDGSFLRGLPRDVENAAILRAIIALGRGLKIDVIAEGVENSEQATLLRQLGCEDMQGFHFSRPLPPDDATALLAEGRKLAARTEAALAQVEQRADADVR